MIDQTFSFSRKNAQELIEWFEEYGVAWPWTEDVGAYGIWISEIMLQQTTVAAVAPRFVRWIERFPSPSVLATADVDDVLREWEGLGYYNRARNLHKAAGIIVEKHHGVVPSKLKDLLGLPGIGTYTAAAISSMAYGVRVPSMDANVRRIVQRLSNHDAWDKALERQSTALLTEAMPEKNPGRLNGALMQLGQILCRPKQTECESCPLSSVCRAYELGRQGEIPKATKKAITDLDSELAIVVVDDSVYLEKRIQGVGRGLWFFPRRPSEDLGPGRPLPRRTHTYTKYRERLAPRVFLVRDRPWDTLTESGEWHLLGHLETLPMASVYRRITQDLFQLLVDRPQ